MSIAVVGVVGVRPRAPLLADEATHVVSPELRHPLKEAHYDLASKKYAEAISKLKAAEAIPGRAPYGQHVINDLLAYAYVKTQDYADAAKTMEIEVGDGLTAASLPQQIRPARYVIVVVNSNAACRRQ